MSLHSSIPSYKVLLRTTQYYSILKSTSYSVLRSTIPFDNPTHETPSTMHKVTGVTPELHQILRLPQKMILMIDPCLTWNVKHNARSNRNHHPTSPNIAPAMKNDSHHWSSSLMKPDVQCAEQPAINLQPHHILRLQHKMTSMIDARHIWHAIYNARSNRGQPPTSPDTAPATKKRLWGHLPISIGITLQHHQILHLPRKNYFTALLLYWAVTWLNCNFTELLLY